MHKFVAATLTSLDTAPHPSWPDRDTLRHFKGNFGGIVVPELQYGFPNKVLFTPGYVTESSKVRAIIRRRYLDAGLRHFPLNLYNDTPIYRDFYPPWDDSQINMFCGELLDEGIIPVGSAFADGAKLVKSNIDPTLVPCVFTGWENPAPIARPALDADNLFWVARQYFKNSLIYWHNPPFQGAPYVNPSDWGGNPEPNAAVWHYMVDNSTCQGLLAQGQAWIKNGQYSLDRLNDFINRLIHGLNGWPICDLIDFEEVVYFNTTLQGSPLLTGEFLRNQLHPMTGYCNG